MRQLFDNGRWATQIAWQTNRPLVLSLMANTAAAGLLPAGVALILRQLVNRAVDIAGGAGPGFSSLVPFLIAALALSVAEALTGNLDEYLTSRFADEVDLQINTQILEHASRLEVGMFEDLRFQDMIQLAQQNTSKHFSQFLATSLGLVARVVQTVSLALVLAEVEPLAVVVALPFSLAHLLFQWRLSQRLYLEENSRVAKRRWTRYFVSLLTDRRSVAESRLLGLSALLVQRFRSLMSEFRDQNRRIYWTAFWGNTVFTALSTAVFFVILANIYRSFVQGGIRVGDLVMFGTVGLRLRTSLEGSVNYVNRANEHALYISNLRQFLALQPRYDPVQGLRPEPVRGDLELRDVSFRYPASETPALSHVSLHIPAGQTVALVGRNGAGKTTLVKLIARFYDPQGGSILLDGVDLCELSAEHLHRQIAFVFQELSPYEATARENIAFGDWKNLMQNPQRVEEIARATGADRLIGKMPQGYDTLLGRRFGEYDLSLGQWQQMAIARALARQAPVLILDEPASNLDAMAEFEMFKSFRRLAKGRTTILISHRFSTVRMADQIIVMDKGQVVEVGTHDQLAAQRGLYARLYDIQRHQLMLTSWEVEDLDGSPD